MTEKQQQSPEPQVVFQGRSIYPGTAEGEALVTTMGISFFGGVDPDSGVVVEKGHELEGQSVTGKVLVFPTGKGSTVGSYTLYRLSKAGKAPLAILNAECEPITAVGCIIAEIPCIDQIPIEQIATGDHLRLDGASGQVEKGVFKVWGRTPHRRSR
jgi:predicted aconitase with swiveling domain